jgi:hypothetical protein
LPTRSGTFASQPSGGSLARQRVNTCDQRAATWHTLASPSSTTVLLAQRFLQLTFFTSQRASSLSQWSGTGWREARAGPQVTAWGHLTLVTRLLPCLGLALGVRVVVCLVAVAFRWGVPFLLLARLFVATLYKFLCCRVPDLAEGTVRLGAKSFQLEDWDGIRQGEPQGPC